MTVAIEFASVGELRRCWFCTYTVKQLLFCLSNATAWYRIALHRQQLIRTRLFKKFLVASEPEYMSSSAQNPAL
jgi:hypothetical protein